MSKIYHLDITDKKTSAHICDFEQNSDGSIYVKFPYFDSSKWIMFDDKDKKIIPQDAPGKGKLSIHGSGITHVKTFTDNASTKFRVKGHHLLSNDKKSAGIRHLITIFPKEPDLQTLDGHESDIKPMVFVMFAVPFGLNISFQASFEIDDCESIPPIIGVGNQSLRMHNILWFSYHTKNMGNWPKSTHVHFSDGFFCPIFIGIDKEKMRIEMRKPQYSIKDKTVEILI